MGLVQLKAALEAEPLRTELASLLEVANDWAVADMLNAPTERGPVSIGEVAAYCLNNGIVGLAKATADESTTPLSDRALCHTLLEFLSKDRWLETADLDDPRFVAACDGLIQIGIMTAQHKSDLLALANNRQGLGEKILGRKVSPVDVGACR